MTDPHAAFGIYSHKIGENGSPLDLASGAMLEDYYLNLYGGNFLVTVTGMTDDEVTTDGILRIAEAASEILSRDDDPPPLVASLQATEPPPNRVYYLRGTLAAAAVAPFALEDRLDWILIEEEPGVRAELEDREGNQMRLVVAGAKIVMIVADEAVHADTAFERLRRGLEDPATKPH